MAHRFQFRLRAMFYAMTIAAVLCLVLPPIFRAVHRHLAAKRGPPAPLPIHVTIDVSLPQMETTSIRIGSDDGLPADDTFFQTTIIRVNGKRVDADGKASDDAPKHNGDTEKLP